MPGRRAHAACTCPAFLTLTRKMDERQQPYTLTPAPLQLPCGTRVPETENECMLCKAMTMTVTVPVPAQPALR